MFQTVVIVILLGMIVYLVFDKKGIKKDDVKAFLKNTGTKTKEKASACFEKARVFFNAARDEAKIRNEEKKRMEAELKQQEDSKIRQDEFMNQNHTDDAFTYKENTGSRRCFRCFMLVALILFICIAPFAYKKTMLDYDGKYATDRLVYTEEFGFCLLITYYPQYREENAKGFAVTNIPFEDLFSEEIQANKYGNDTADSKDLLGSYQMLATLGDNELDSLAKLFFDSKISTRSVQIGKYGNYFATTVRDMVILK